MSLDVLATPSLDRLRLALRAQDPTAEVAFVDGRLRVDSVLADDAVLAIARRELGDVEAAPMQETREGCCGGCGGAGH
ncbi:MAG TPA: hypothetical protein VFY12_06745 [Arenimonas sp.]|nr:hypothetical protein [Arenimonas sp.]